MLQVCALVVLVVVVAVVVLVDIKRVQQLISPTRAT